MTKSFPLPKAERANSKKLLDRLFKGGCSKSMSAFPIRMVYMAEERGEDSRAPRMQMMVSVPKRYFKHAVKRNHVKRLVREAYRLNKDAILNHLPDGYDRTLTVCFIWTDSELRTFAVVEEKIKGLLTRLGEKMTGRK